MTSREACVLGACCPLGIAAQVPGTDGRPGFASTGFPVSFAALVCSCRAAERGRQDRGGGDLGLLTPGTGTGVKSQFGSLDGGNAGESWAEPGVASQRGEDATSPLLCEGA